MSNDRHARPENLIALANAGGDAALTDDQESVWREVIQRVDEVYSDLIRYEADLEAKNSELEEAQSFISSVIASVSDVLVVCDVSGLMLQTNPAFVNLLGYPEATLAGRPLTDFIDVADRDRAMRHVVSGAQGRVSDCELRFLTVRGPSDVMAVNCSTRFDHAGRCVGAVLTGRPIGELRRAYQALHAAHLELQQAQRKLIEQEKMASLGRLVAGVAHELNNPISFVYGNIHVLERYRRNLSGYFAMIDKEPAQERAADLRKAFHIDAILGDLTPLIDGTLEGAKRISEIVKNLRRLSFNRASEAQEINLERIIATAAHWASRSKKSQARIEFDVAAGLVMSGNEGQIHQIVVNLVDNALDAVTGRKDAQVEIKAVLNSGEIEISVADNGPGIAETVLDKMFEPFFTTKSVGEGTGLGLWISYSIAREHGGSIKASNRPEGGAVFVIKLPASASTA
ncbi:MAG: ATP-binding protein [Beijerinckiaceae bacterium]|nr:ATP-binding protein [Beijerinckiaceae bacterium]